MNEYCVNVTQTYCVLTFQIHDANIVFSHCLFACQCFLFVWGYIFAYGFAMYGVQSRIDTLRFGVLVLISKLRQCDSNIFCFGIWMRIHDANIVFLHVNVFCVFEDTSSHMVFQCVECNQELIHWDLACLCLKANCVQVTRTHYVLTFAIEFLMHTLSFRMSMFEGLFEIHVHIWICDVCATFRVVRQIETNRCPDRLSICLHWFFICISLLHNIIPMSTLILMMLTSYL